jgi:pSer/pThr/pTyr-binding forkhead associated (FHA) protein
MNEDGSRMKINLVVFKKSGSQKSFPLPSSITVIGRRKDCDLQIPLEAVSRRHCQLNHDKGTLKIRDLGSRNGTYLNGKRIEEAEAQAGDYIKVGPLEFALQIDGRPENISIPSPSMWESSMEEVTTSDSTIEEATTSDSTVEDDDTFAELDELDSLDSLDEMDSL